MLTVLTLIPIISILLCLIVFKMKVTQSGAISLGFALIIAVVFFGINGYGLLTASGKASWLALFVSLIVWNALLLYHLVSDFGALEVINKNIAVLVKDEFVAFVMLSWTFTGFLQGIAGFGIPSLIVAPILIALGHNPLKSITAALLGNSWSITFGSMGTAFYVIKGLTDISEFDLGFPVWVFNTVTIVMTGLGVCFIYNGFKGIKRGLLYVLPVSAIMSTIQYFTIHLGIYSLAGLNTALAGAATMLGLYKIRCRGKFNPSEPHNKNQLTLLQSVFPYALIVALLLSFQFIPEKIRDKVAIAAIPDYNPIKLFVHPGMVLLIAAAVACIIYKKANIWNSKTFKGVIKKTVAKGVPATLALLAFGHMSLIMMDSGMMYRLANAVADLTGNLYPFAAPLIGVLGTFLTGNNTNSNVMFGNFQYEVAQKLELSEAVMSAVQTISGGLGCAIASTLVFMAALATKQTDKIPIVLKRLIPIVLIIAGVMGIINYIFINNYIFRR